MGKPRSVAELTTEIVAAYITRNSITMVDLIGEVGRELKGLGREEPKPSKPEPAVPVRRSIQEHHLVCLVCGKRQKTLRRHLDIAHQLTPEVYRERFGLRPDYPMVAPGYARQRSEMAKRVGLGRRVPAPPRQEQPRRTG